MEISRIAIPATRAPKSPAGAMPLWLLVAGIVVAVLLGGLSFVATPDARAALENPDWSAQVWD